MTDADGVVRWYTADPRGVIPLDGRFHVSRSLARLVRRSPEAGGFEIRINANFEQTMRACMEQRAGETWISEELVRAYVRLYEIGYAHSVEAWRDGRLAGGLYGISLGAAFFGESMFHRERDASKVALVHLVERLRARGYQLLDSQAVTPHLARFGCYEIPADEYLKLLDKALEGNCRFA